MKNVVDVVLVSLKEIVLEPTALLDVGTSLAEEDQNAENVPNS
ncbi:hypothetical protein A2U01_0084370, partial [Trifolium medium]|nr:hypothetical protein [Trifolium medium]